jgi:LysM repeat protein
MNNQSPLVPQGSLLEQKNKGRARVKIAVFFVLTIHGVALLALLMQGCQKEKDTSAKAEQTNPSALSFDPTNASSPELAQVPTPTNTYVAPIEQAQTPTQPSNGAEYVVAQGDTFSKIASKVKVPMAAVIAANPGVEPTKLRPGQKLHIPPAPPVMASAATPAGTSIAAPATSAGGEQVYTVKSGDNLIKIGGQFGVSVKAIRSANSLKTDSIRVGQKLKIPGKVSGPAANETAAAAPVMPR